MYAEKCQIIKIQIIRTQTLWTLRTTTESSENLVKSRLYYSKFLRHWTVTARLKMPSKRRKKNRLKSPRTICKILEIREIADLKSLAVLKAFAKQIFASFCRCCVYYKKRKRTVCKIVENSERPSIFILCFIQLYVCLIIYAEWR